MDSEDKVMAIIFGCFAAIIGAICIAAMVTTNARYACVEANKGRPAGDVIALCGNAR